VRALAWNNNHLIQFSKLDATIDFTPPVFCVTLALWNISCWMYTPSDVVLEDCALHIVNITSEKKTEGATVESMTDAKSKFGQQPNVS
jgi:hypothetical protein